MHVEFKILDDKDTVINNAEIYTTCIETIYGITFLVMAVPTHDQKVYEFAKNSIFQWFK